MGDRALVQFYNHDFGADPPTIDNVPPLSCERGPVVYLHWQGAMVPELLRRTEAVMRARQGDVEYTTARFIEQACMENPETDLSVGVFNADRLLYKQEDSHGDAGIILVNVSPRHWFHAICIGGYMDPERISIGMEF